MFIRISFLSIVFFATIFIYLSALNPLGVTFQYFKGYYIETSLSILLVSSFFIGAFLTFFVYTIRDIRRGFKERKLAKEQQQLWDLFYSATEALFKDDLPKAERQLLTYIKKKGDDPKAYLKLAEVYQRQGKIKKAIDTLEGARALKRDKFEILFMEAQIYKGAKDYDGALRTYQEIVALNPNNREAIRELRDIYITQKQWEEALKLQRRLIPLAPKGEADQENKLLLGLHYERAKDLAERGKISRAIKEAKEIIKEEPSFIPAQVLLGDLLHQTDKDKEAVKVWRRGFEKTGETIFLTRLEDLYLSQAHPRAIIDIYLDAMAKKPEDIIIPFYYARLCLRLEMIDEALEKLQEMDIHLANYPAYHYLLAEIYAHRGNHEKATAEYRKGLRLEGVTIIPYRCTYCQKEIKNWHPMCPYCGQWGTIITPSAEGATGTITPLPTRLAAWDT